MALSGWNEMGIVIPSYGCYLFHSTDYTPLTKINCYDGAYKGHQIYPSLRSVMQYTSTIGYTICDTGAQHPSLAVFGFLFYHILHCICLKMFFTESKYFVSN